MKVRISSSYLNPFFLFDHLKIDSRALRHQRSGGSVASSSGSNQRLDPELRWVDAPGRRKLPKTRQIINRAKISVPPQSNVFSQSTIFRDSNEKLCDENRYLNCKTVTLFLGQTWSVKILKLVFRIFEEIFLFLEVKSRFSLKLGYLWLATEIKSLRYT